MLLQEAEQKVVVRVGMPAVLAEFSRTDRKSSMSTPIDQIVERLSWEMESWKTIEFRIHQEYHLDGTLPGQQALKLYDSYVLECRYVETSLGKRFLEEAITTSDSDTPQVNTKYSDGKLAASLARRSGETHPQLSITRFFEGEQVGDTGRPYPLKAFYVGLQPLHKAIPRATLIGTDRCLGRECEKFVFRAVPHRSTKWDLVYYLDTATSIPLKIKIYDSEALREADRPIVTWSALSFDEIEGHHFPARSELVATHIVNQSSLPSHTVKYVTESVSFNHDYPASMFWPEITDKMAVINHVTGKITQPKVTKPTKAEAETAATQATPPIRADDRAGVSFGTVALWLGTALLAATILVWFRRRMSTRSA
jgi:hypothetical protein